MYRVIAAFVVFLAFMAPAYAEQAPANVAGATTISTDQAVALFDEGVLFVDVRKSSDFDAGRVPGSVNLYLNDGLSADSLGSEVGKDEKVVFYCNGVKCAMSSEACAKAVAWGYTQVYYMREGFPAWETAGLPVE